MTHTEAIEAVMALETLIYVTVHKIDGPRRENAVNALVRFLVAVTGKKKR